MNQERCRATTKEGKPCNALAWDANGLCRWHSPELAEKRAEGARRGGKNRSNAARARKALATDVRSLNDVKARLMTALAKVESGDLEPGRANAMAALARAIAAVGQVGDYEERLQRLEQLIERRNLA